MSEVTVDGAAIDILYAETEIAERIDAIAGEVAGERLLNILVIAVLKGSFIFAADLLRAFYRVGLAPEVDFISLSSYRDATASSGRISILRDVESDVAGRAVILIDDILESGRTLAYAKDLMAARDARPVKTCVLLEKPGKLAAEITADYVGFHCPDRFVVGYGMDMGHEFRQLPFVGVVS